LVWGHCENKPLSKEVRALKRIEKGSELVANYIESWEGSFSDAKQRQKILSRWNFECACAVCSLPVDLLEQNDRIRKQIIIQHSLVPKFMARWNVRKALEAARRKLALSLQIEDDILCSLPATYLEVYEMARLAQVVGEKVDIPDSHLKTAHSLSQHFGYAFVQSYLLKVQQIDGSVHRGERKVRHCIHTIALVLSAGTA